jgi:hypothetical protein
MAAHMTGTRIKAGRGFMSFFRISNTVIKIVANPRIAVI